ncbi:MAG TPA: putative toxin-antitoxin system toxin component, PIN family [Candidatus Magasanikbacteria bacterium]|uniref:PilT protein domain protein n=1 Tax=Candidatus Magasanikbacteria bacterium GW2011_GWC2_41_17 TaxID=1619048 RepID=A0A0G0YG27_9BACT|nr:MAG: PilT protein domain protein [Candidatus Magasanikbacteria bacterium GW2011_GWC2_41_17]HBV58366.1 putative toxin-antitoxin system toxin component, PIN family [Candidatus Magasanikbacteria bacterium]HBX15927.1 putative toxin-antitoxin system toxin component, PIN family [Candidatus Magasanikbacteria bacterium]
MRVVLDTNVLISALFWKGKAALILDLAEKGTITVCLTKEILDEIIRVLNYPKIYKHLSSTCLTVNDILHYITELAEFYHDAIQLKNMIKDDPSDNKFLSCALASRAKYIISGDAHILKLKSFVNISIVTPAVFLSIFKK